MFHMKHLVDNPFLFPKCVNSFIPIISKGRLSIIETNIQIPLYLHLSVDLVTFLITITELIIEPSL